MADRFDLEQAIMAAWGTSNDIEVLWKRYYECKPSIDVAEKQANAFMGLAEIHEARMNVLWEIFEELVNKREL